MAVAAIVKIKKKQFPALAKFSGRLKFKPTFFCLFFHCRIFSGKPY